MNSRVAIVASLVGLVVAAGVGLYLSSKSPEPAPVSAPTRTTRPASDDTAAAPPSAPRATAARPATAPPPAPADTPEAEVVEAPPTTGTLAINSDVAGAQVFIDRNFVGVTPLTVPNVAPGSHRLNLSAEGHEGILEMIDVAPGPRDIRFEFNAVRLDASIRVVHKHTFGSCEGTLAATPSGLRYDTTNKGDAFTSPLVGVEAFAVDYLKKTLTLRVKGKTYNFTDPEANADRLFVFHRDVERARTRLATR